MTRLERYEAAQARKAERARRNQEIILAAKSSGCVRCGEADPVVLDFHHRDPATKLRDISSMRQTGEEQGLREEIAKCDVLCCNCHRKIHAADLHFVR